MDMECGNCTLCCKLLETHDIQSDIGVYCKHCDLTEGCTIYSGRPKECSAYKCAWLQMENVGIELRPDNSHVIFDRIADKTICARQDSDYELSELVINQIKQFNKQNFSVLLLCGNLKSVHLTKGHTMKEVKKDFYDCSIIY